MVGLPSFRAWAYDAKFHVLTGPITIMPMVTAGGEVVYRVPACATLTEPPPDPPPPRKLVYLQSTGHWIEVSDHRGETWFDYANRPTTIERLGDPSHWGLSRVDRSQSGSGRQSCSSCG